jgi:non-ribosomal peptide synthetase component F/aryl carrier-like protein
MATRVEGVEPALAAIWAEVLDVEQVAFDDDFFELGGTSLLAMQIVARASDAFGVELELDALFDAPTVAGLAQAIEGARPAAAPGRQSRRRRGRREAPQLSDLQASAWAVALYTGAKAHVGDAFRLEGPLDVAALERALTELVARHEILRTIFPLERERPVPRVLPAEPVRIPVTTLARGGGRRGDAELDELVSQAREEAFDYRTQPPLRIRLIRRGAASHVLVLLTHEIVCDGWGFDALVRELSLLYNAFAAGRPSPLRDEPPLQYADVVAQRAERGGGRNGGDPELWRRALAGAPLTLPLPADSGGRPARGEQLAVVRGGVPAAVSAGLRALGREEASTSFMVHLAAFYALLQRHTGEPRLLVTSPAANRVRTELEEVIGFLSRVLPLCVEAGDDPSLRELLRRTREATLHAFAHADALPEDNRIRELTGMRGLLGVGAVFRLWDATLERRLELDGVRCQSLEEGGEGSMVGLVVTEAPGRETQLELSSSALGKPAVEAMLGHYRRALEQLAASPDRRLGELDLLSDAERRQLVAGWNRAAGGGDDRLLHGLVEAQAARAPGAVALCWGASDGLGDEHGELTYGELDAQANRLARVLRERGVARGTRVGIALGPSAELVVALLAVLKAGGTCVVRDAVEPAVVLAGGPGSPQPGAGRSVASGGRRADVPVAPSANATQPAGTLVRGSTPPRVVDLDAERDAIAAADDAPLADGAAPDDVALVLPTAGVTGAPKAVELSHRALVHAAAWRQHAYRLGPSERVVHVPGPGVAAWKLSVWAPLAAGAQIVIPEQAPDAPGPRVVHWLDARGVTFASLPPELAASCLESPDAERTALRTLAVHGRGALPAPPDDRRARIAVLREYAVAETGGLVFSTRAREEQGAAGLLASESPTALGAIAYVLDAAMRLVPSGAAGELWLGGAGVASGYAGDPERTAQAFAVDPFSDAPGARLVRTGDLARRRLDGTLELLGRVADQVRYRGFRLTPCMEQIEQTLAAHPGVAACATGWDPDGAVLAAYVVPRRGAPPETAELDRWLQERMPDWVLPGRWVAVAQIPRRADGSPDRAALARAGGEPLGPDPGRTQPATRTEKKLQSVWKKVLDRRGVGVNESFYALGGDLIRGLELIERARRDGIRIDTEDLMLRPTIAELAAIAERRPG